MQTLYLPPLARSRLAQQITQNGNFVHTLYGDNGVSCVAAAVVVEQNDSSVSVRVELGDSINSITLDQREDTGARVAQYLEELANGVTISTAAVGSEGLLVGELELTLREAVRLQLGIYELPVEEVENLWLRLRPSDIDSGRTVFQFELDSVGLTLPLRLPCDRRLAYEMLLACVQEFVASYRRKG